MSVSSICLRYVCPIKRPTRIHVRWSSRWLVVVYPSEHLLKAMLLVLLVNTWCNLWLIIIITKTSATTNLWSKALIVLICYSLTCVIVRTVELVCMYIFIKKRKDNENDRLSIYDETHIYVYIYTTHTFIVKFLSSHCTVYD